MLTPLISTGFGLVAGNYAIPRDAPYRKAMLGTAGAACAITGLWLFNLSRRAAQETREDTQRERLAAARNRARQARTEMRDLEREIVSVREQLRLMCNVPTPPDGLYLILKTMGLDKPAVDLLWQEQYGRPVTQLELGTEGAILSQ